jgi:hypothetical protein
VTTFAPLLELLAQVPDPRRGQGQIYKLPYVLLFAILSLSTQSDVLSGFSDHAI